MQYEQTAGRGITAEIPLSRRRLAAGVAWATPAILVSAAAPTWAASQCVNYGYKYGSTTTVTTVAPVTVSRTGANPVTMSFSQKQNGGTATSLNYRVSDQAFNGANAQVQVGYTSERGIILNQFGAGASQDLTITFSRPVYNLMIYVRDLTWRSNSDKDAVGWSVTPSRITNVSNSGVGLSGVGSFADPTVRVATGANNGAGGTWYDVQFFWAGPLSSITMRYSNALTTATGYQYIELPEYSFCALPTGP